MATEFFSIGLVPGKAQIRIEAKVDYEFSYVLDSNTNLINENEFYVCKLPQIRTVYLYKLHDKTNNLIAW